MRDAEFDKMSLRFHQEDTGFSFFIQRLARAFFLTKIVNILYSITSLPDWYFSARTYLSDATWHNNTLIPNMKKEGA